MRTETGQRDQRAGTGADLGEPHRVPAHPAPRGDRLDHHRGSQQVLPDKDVGSPGRRAVMALDPDTAVGVAHRGAPA